MLVSSASVSWQVSGGASLELIDVHLVNGVASNWVSSHSGTHYGWGGGILIYSTGSHGARIPSRLTLSGMSSISNCTATAHEGSGGCIYSDSANVLAASRIVTFEHHLPHTPLSTPRSSLRTLGRRSLCCATLPRYTAVWRAA